MIPEGEIVNIWRAGARHDKDGNLRTHRPLIIEFEDEEDAQYWTNKGKGFKTPDGYYINPDLCDADRHAHFLAREEIRRIKAQRGERGTTMESQQNADKGTQ